MKPYKPFVASLLAGLLLGSIACTKNDTPDAAVSADEPAVSYPLDVCLVSGEKLGGMGEPVRIVHEGREIKFCCESCEPKFKKSPEKYLAKLDGSTGG